MDLYESIDYYSFNMAGGLELNPRRFTSNGYDRAVDDCFLRLGDIEDVLMSEVPVRTREQIMEGRGGRIRREIARMTEISWPDDEDGRESTEFVTDADGKVWAEEEFYSHQDGRIRGFLADEDAGVRALAAGFDLLDDALRGLARDPHWLVRREVVLNRACTGATAAMLVDDPHPDVRYLARRHPELPLRTLVEVLARDDDLLAAALPGPATTLSDANLVPALLLARDATAERLLHQRVLPEGLVGGLVDPGRSVMVRRLATRGRWSLPMDALLRALRDTDEEVRAHVAARANEQRLPEAAVRLAARDASRDVRSWCAMIEYIPPDVLNALADDPDARVREDAVRNEHAPVAALARAYRMDGDPHVRRAAVSNPGFPPDLLVEACADAVTAGEAVSHDSAPEELFAALLAVSRVPGTGLEDPSLERYSRADAEGRSLGMSSFTLEYVVLGRLAEQSWAWLSSMPLEELGRADLSVILDAHVQHAREHQSANVRLAVAGCRGTDDQTLEVLAEDPDEHVRRAAAGAQRKRRRPQS